MDIDRRKVLAGSFCLALGSWVETTAFDLRPGTVASKESTSWHPLTRSLLERAQKASAIDGRDNTASIERHIRDVAKAQGRTEPLVIKWLADPRDASDYLSRLGLHELLQMDEPQLWYRARLQAPFDDDLLNSAAVLGSRIAKIVRSAEHDRALMAPKLLSKARAMAEHASAEEIFEVRAVAAQIGWLETCVPIVAAQAVTDVELFLSLGVSDSIPHQLRMFEAYELGLLATWETADAVICLPRIVQTRLAGRSEIFQTC